jgi:hypothetical protein
VKRLVIADIARADLVSIRRYSTRTWGVEQTAQYMGGHVIPAVLTWTFFAILTRLRF